jgi:hypothetical protein
MPFGPVNGPAIFVEFMHDVDSTWKSLAQARSIDLNDSTNTRIIINNVLSHATSFALAKRFIECQLIVAHSHNLSLNLRKCHWFPSRLEFVGTDVTPDGNRPAQSKHDLLRTWPTPTIVKDVASFVGFAVFYSKYIAWFESRITRLREIIKNDSSTPLNDLWNAVAQSEFDDIRNAILSDPVLRRFDYRRLYLLSDFCKDGF